MVSPGWIAVRRFQVVPSAHEERTICLPIVELSRRGSIAVRFVLFGQDCGPLSGPGCARRVIRSPLSCSRRSPTLVISVVLHAVVDQRPEANGG